MGGDLHTCQVTLNISGNPIENQWVSQKYQGQLYRMILEFIIMMQSTFAIVFICESLFLSHANSIGRKQ